MQFIDLKAQYRQLENPVNKRIKAVLEHGQFILGPEVAELEQKLADYVGVKHCVGVSSGTDALLLALMALDIGQGDEVIMPSFSYIAAAEVTALLGAKPVYVDVCPKTFNIEPARIPPAITPRTKAIIAVSLFGQCADFESINAIGQAHDITVIEDGAQSFGATHQKRRSGALSTIGTTSFFPSKPLGCYGDGGAVFTDSAALAAVIRQISQHGQARRYHHERLGINGRLDTIQAAVLLEKLSIFDKEVALRQRAADLYNARLCDFAHAFSLPFIQPDNTSVYAQYTLCLAHRDQVRDALAEKGIPTAVHYPIPLSHQPAVAEQTCRTEISLSLSQQVLSLPMHPYLDIDDIDRVCDALSLCGRDLF